VIDNPTNAAFARAAVVGPGKVLFSAVQMAFGAEDTDLRLAFSRLRTTLTAAGSGLDKVVYLTAYPVNAKTLDRYRALRFEFLDRAKAPASTNLAFEGLPSLDATLGMEVLATTGN
jgi:enamine deaminase RidA (YjgF/YER057c/UK114 family)